MRLILLLALRRLAASLMLVALASFVLHGGAMAGQHRHGPGSGGCEPTVSAGHVHATAVGAAHDHEDGAAHVHAAHPAADPADRHGDHHHADGGAEAPCCGSACAIALPALASRAISVPMTADAVLLPASQSGAGTEPQGLRRPPRPPCIA